MAERPRSVTPRARASRPRRAPAVARRRARRRSRRRRSAARRPRPRTRPPRAWRGPRTAPRRRPADERRDDALAAHVDVGQRATTSGAGGLETSSSVSVSSSAASIPIPWRNIMPPTSADRSRPPTPTICETPTPARVEQHAASCAPVPAAATMPTGPGDDVGEAEADLPSMAVPQPGPMTSRPGAAPRCFNATSSLDGDVVGEKEDVHARAQRAVGLERGVLAGDRDERDVRGRRRAAGQRAGGSAPRRRRSRAGAASSASARPARRRRPRVDGEHEVAGPASHSTPRAASASRLAGVPMTISPPHAVAAAHALRDAHELHAVRVAVGDHLTCQLTAAPPPGRLRSTCRPRRAIAATSAVGVITSARPPARYEALGGLDLRAHAAGRELARVDARARVGDASAVDSGRSQRVPKSSATRGTAVSSTSRSEPSAMPSSAEQRSLSITAAKPTSASRAATGMPPPPPAITIAPLLEQRARRARAPSTSAAAGWPRGGASRDRSRRDGPAAARGAARASSPP